MLGLFGDSHSLTFDDINKIYSHSVSTPTFAKKISNANFSNPDSQSTHDAYSVASGDTGYTDLASRTENDFASSDIDDEISSTYSKQSLLFHPERAFAKPKKKKEKIYSDRFIPNRKSSKLQLAFTEAHRNEENVDPASIDGNNPQELNSSEDPHFAMNALYRNVVLGYNPSQAKKQQGFQFQNLNLLRYNQNCSDKILQDITTSSLLGDLSKLPNPIQKNTRKIPKVPFKVLDAPALQDDFYLNLIDWSTQNILAVGLSSCVYLWSAHTSKVSKLCDLGVSDTVTSVNWAPRGGYLSVGTNSGEVQIWDPVKLKKIRTMTGHTGRVGTIGWNSSVLASGSRDKNILYRDIRLPTNYISKLVGHKQEVCGLKWSFDDQQLCSGGNDNKLFIWNLHSTSPVLKFTNHTAAVKALAWSPHQHGLLASGGGTADRTIRFWNTLLNTQVSYLDTGSQVCNLMFSKNVNELVSTHGYSLNQIVVWKYPSMEKTVTLTGHSYRVLYLAMSPDGQTIVTGAGDETLRFWQVFPSAKKEEPGTVKQSKLTLTDFDLR